MAPEREENLYLGKKKKEEEARGRTGIKKGNIKGGRKRGRKGNGRINVSIVNKST